tara:strand:- start:3297 stop:3536 length:240 start_codon:yes stop_codon:yes gene_type:complete
MKNTRTFAARAAAVSLAAGSALVATSASAQAAGPDFTTLTGAIDLTSTQEAILSVGAVAIGLAVVVLGVRKIMQMVRGA